MTHRTLKKVATPRFRRAKGRGHAPEHGSAADAASDVLSVLEGVWTETVNSHFSKVVEWMWDKDATGATEEEALRSWINQPPESRRPAMVQTGLVICAYAVETLRAESRGQVASAWRALARANYWLGFMLGAKGGDSKAALKDGRSRGTKKRSETYGQARQWVWAKWQEEKAEYGGKRAAAARDYERLIPQRFTTAGGDPLKVKRETLTATWLKEPPPKVGGSSEDDS